MRALMRHGMGQDYMVIVLAVVATSLLVLGASLTSLYLVEHFSVSAILVALLLALLIVVLMSMEGLLTLLIRLKVL